MTVLELAHKSLAGGETKVLSEDEGIVEALVSVTGIRDEVKDIIIPGAYEKTLTARRPKGVFSHDWDRPIAKAIDVTELFPGDSRLPRNTARGEPWPQEAGALKVRAQFNLDTRDGRDAFSNVKFFGDEQEWSIGYTVPRGASRMDSKTSTRYLDSLDLFEFSPVLFGAMPLAGTQSVKGLLVRATDAKALTAPLGDDERAYLSPSEILACESLRLYL